jgi:hypothetical protein
MLKSINKEKLSKAIQQTYKTMNETSSDNLASQLIEGLDEAVEEALDAWIEGKDIPDVSHGEYSLIKILTCRNSQDYLMAIRFLSDYIKDPVEGKKQIRKPIRGRRGRI